MAREKTPEENAADNERKQAGGREKKFKERTAGPAKRSKAPGKGNCQTGR